MNNLDFTSLLNSGKDNVIIPITNQESHSNLLSTLRNPEVTVICDQNQRDIYLQLLSNK